MPVNAAPVNWRPRSGLKMSGGPGFASASSTAAIRKSAAIVIATRWPRTGGRTLDGASELRVPGLSTGEACQWFRQAKLGGTAGGRRVDVLDSEGEFAFVVVVGAALFGAAIGENTPRYGAVLDVDGQEPAVWEIGRHDRRLVIMELGEAGIGIGVDEGLPMDPANPLRRAQMKVSCAPQSPRHSVSNSACPPFPAI
jgi:hypothetical protein